MKFRVQNLYIAYGTISLPIAMVALPVYVYVPKFYGQELGISIGTIGLVILCLRIFDAIQDPAIGMICDLWKSKRFGRKHYIGWGSPLLLVGFIAIFNPLTTSQTGHVMWLTMSLAVLYSGLSIIYINYLALGAEIGNNAHEHTKIAASRACFAIFGITVASATPELLSAHYENLAKGLSIFSLAFIPVFTITLLVFFSKAPSPTFQPKPLNKNRFTSQILSPLRNKQFRGLLGVFIFSGMANAIPGLLILFFVNDILQTENINWVFILIYFLSSGIAIPFWVNISKKLGEKKAWVVGMLLAVVSFSGAFFIKSGDIALFAIVCVSSGFANGSDLTLPFSILSNHIHSKLNDRQPQSNSSYFGIWQFVEKTNLGLAAGLSLPILGLLNYQPGLLTSNYMALQFMYALVPCCLKLIGIILLISLKMNEK